jgi:hypothetical protein
VWDLAGQTIVRTVPIPGSPGTIDVTLIPGDPQRRAFTAGMFDGLVYLVETSSGTRGRSSIARRSFRMSKYRCAEA